MGSVLQVLHSQNRNVEIAGRSVRIPQGSIMTETMGTAENEYSTLPSTTT